MRHYAILLCCLLVAACDQKPAEQQAVAVAPGCATDWRKCVDNIDLVHNWVGWTKVPADCERAAETQLAGVTPLWADTPFTSYLPGNVYVTSGKAVAMELEAPLRDAATGVIVHAKIVCEFDLRKRGVTGLFVVPMDPPAGPPAKPPAP